MVGIFNFGCNEEDAAPTDEYYVKYIVDGSSRYTGTLKVTFYNEKNVNKEIVIDQNARWEVIVGPVSKGFNAKLKVVISSTGYLKLHSEIHTSKNGSPFAIKSMHDSDYGSSIQTSYTIDY
jgi:hypothetical protein